MSGTARVQSGLDSTVRNLSEASYIVVPRW